MILLTAVYTIGLRCTSIQLRGHADCSVVLSIAHDNRMTVNAVELAGNATTDHYIVKHNDTFTITARQQQGHIIAAGIFEVSCEAAAQFNTLLSPCTVFNLVVDQADGAIFDRAFEEALAAACADTAVVEVVR